MFIVIFFTISFLFACGGGSGGGLMEIRGLNPLKLLLMEGQLLLLSSADYTAKFNADGVLLEVTGPNSTKFIYTYPSEDVMEKRYYESDVLKTVTIFHYNQPTFFDDGTLDSSQKSDWVRVYDITDGITIPANASLKYRVNYNNPNGDWLVNAIQVYTTDTDPNDTDSTVDDTLSNEKKEFTYYSDNSVKTITYYDGSTAEHIATIQTFSTPIDIEEGTKIVEVVQDNTGAETTYSINEYITADTVTEELLSTVEDGEPDTAISVTIDFDGVDDVLGTADDGTVSGTDNTTLSPVETEYLYTYETGSDAVGNWFKNFYKEVYPFN